MVPKEPQQQLITLSLENFFSKQTEIISLKFQLVRAATAKKSAFECYAAAALMAGTRLGAAKEYMRRKVAPRLAKNKKLWAELGMNDAPVWMPVRGVLQPMHVLKVDVGKIHSLMGWIAKGLYFYHFGKPLSTTFYPDVCMFRQDVDAAVWASLLDYFPAEAKRVEQNLGGGAFVYEGAQSPANENFTIWRMAWHNGIPLHGSNTPPSGIAVFSVVTRPAL